MYKNNLFEVKLLIFKAKLKLTLDGKLSYKTRRAIIEYFSTDFQLFINQGGKNDE